ncbi:hypothetical protein J6590_050773 [Homalodisca vitripennis]|nr:hypothetical protein J6590_050773 [Homalodisca vitripennis]
MAIKIGLIFGVPCHLPPCHPASVWTSPAPRAESGVSFEHVTGLTKLSVCGAQSAMPSTACQYKKLHGVQCTSSDIAMRRNAVRAACGVSQPQLQSYQLVVTLLTLQTIPTFSFLLATLIATF